MIFFSENTFAQKHFGTIKGRITGANGKPAINVTVELKKVNRISVTDVNGNFTLQHLPALKDTLIISSVDSKPLYREVQVGTNEKADLGTINLEYSIQQLQSVEIDGAKAILIKVIIPFLSTKQKRLLLIYRNQFPLLQKSLLMIKWNSH